MNIVDANEQVERPRFFGVQMDDQQNIVTEWEDRALKAGLPEAVRNYLKERLISATIDRGKAQDMTQLRIYTGRILELRDLLDLFAV